MMPMRFRDVQKKKKEVKESAGRRAQYESESEYETRIRQLAETQFRAAEKQNESVRFRFAELLRPARQDSLSRSRSRSVLVPRTVESCNRISSFF